LEVGCIAVLKGEDGVLVLVVVRVRRREGEEG